MADSITLTLPQDIADYIRAIAENSAQSIEQVVVDKLRALVEAQPSELVALNALSTDALRVIFLEEMGDEIHLRINYLKGKKSQENMTVDEASELQNLIERENQFHLRKTTAEAILRERGYFQTPSITLPTVEIKTFCQTHQISRLLLFGSALRNDFSPESDVDVLVEFQPSATVGFIAFAQMENELTGLLGRKVDLLTPQALSEHFREDVLATAQVIYEQR